MAAFIELIAKIKQKNNGTFKLVDAQDVECEDGKGLDEVLNEKLETNLGADNADKVVITDSQGNIITQNKEDFEGGGTGNYNDLENKPTINGIELSGNKTSKDLKMYTQEEVNYLLDDKMDKPYFDVAITDDTTIENTLAGNFKMDSIEGNIYQAEESDIVPTPERPIPIRSKKITVNGEIVELRSLKESKNLFDKNLLIISKTDSQRDTPAIQLKDKETYTISCSKNGVECTLGVRAKRKSDNLDVEIQLLRGVTEQGSFTVDYTTYENYFVRVYSTAYDTIDTIQLELGSSATFYVPPTVRDYKIVDHKTKTSKIVRNVKNIDLSSIGYQYQTGIDHKPYRVANYVYNLTSIQGSYKYIYANSEKVYSYNGFQSQMENGLCVSENGIMRVVNGVTNEDELKTYVDNNRVDILYALATPTEESIPYLEDDTSEVGLSWQDTTSPSPDIKSEIYEVNNISIKLVGKNVLDEEKLQNFDNYDKTLTSQGFTEYVLKLKPNTQYTVSRKDIIGYQQGAYIKVNNVLHEYGGGAKWLVTSHSESENKQNVTITTNDDGLLILLFNNNIEIIKSNLERIGYLQVEEGNVATSHNIYQETSIRHTLSKPLRATKDGSIRDVIDIVNMQITYNMTDFIVDGNTTIALDTDKEKTRVIQINNQPFLNPTNNLKMYCDKLLNDSGKDEELFTVSTALFISIDKNRVETNDINAFKKWFGENPLYFIGISKNPTTEPLDDELVQKLKTLKTFSPVTHVFVEGIAKPKLNAKYPKDIASAQQQLEAKVITLQEAVIKNV